MFQQELGDMELFMSGHVGDVSLPVLAWLVSWELVQGQVYLEGSLWVGLGTHPAGGADL